MAIDQKDYPKDEFEQTAFLRDKYQLSARATHCLQFEFAGDPKKLAEAMNESWRLIARIPNVGPGTLEELFTFVRRLGLYFPKQNEALDEPKERSRLVEKYYWSCGRADHYHGSFSAAARCIADRRDSWDVQADEYRPWPRAFGRPKPSGDRHISSKKSVKKN